MTDEEKPATGRPDPDRAKHAAADSDAPTDESSAPGSIQADVAPVRYRVLLKPGRERAARMRHPWIFASSIESVEGYEDAQPGDLGEVLTSQGEWLGLAMVNVETPLAVRFLQFAPGEITRAWFEARFAQALTLRERMVPSDTDSYRLVHGEGDGLSGLIVDRYGEYLVVQCMAAGMSRMESLWLPALVAQLAPAGVLERSRRARRDQNLHRTDQVLHGAEPPVDLVIREGGHRFRVDLRTGQKTGFYLDQRENRRLLARLVPGGEVLNLFAYSGGFSVYAGAEGGVRRMVAVETSTPARELLAMNWELNGLAAEQLTTVGGTAQEFLRQTSDSFDLIIVDPPAFAKERRQVEKAARAYKDVNLWAMKRLKPGGFLATFSCSQHIDPDLFQKIIFGASVDAQRPLQWLRRLGPGPDHPVHLDHPQGEYLKGLLLRALETGAGQARSLG
jgi:23S rRNA (cytosine1962-C5)-methyltransferase